MSSTISVKIIGESLIGENTALNGGGIYATNGCSVIVDSGVDINNSSDLRGIMGNNASNNGGGIYANLGASIKLYGNVYNGNSLVFPYISAGNSSKPVTLANNSAVDGGGIYADRNSQVTVIDGLIDNNTATTVGGGFYIGDGSELNIKQSSASTCWNDNNKCSIISNNKAGSNGGGMYLYDGSMTQVEKSYIFGNRSNFGTAIYARSANTVGVFLNNIIYRNGENGDVNYSDNYVIRANLDARLIFHHNTIANNNIADDRAIFGITGDGTLLNISNSIINNNETILESVSGASYTASCVLIDETSTLSGINVANLAPSFVDANNDDYHIDENSNAIDFCSQNGTFTELEEDIDNGIRPIDDPNWSSGLGIADAGADEYSSTGNDVIFANSFE